MDDGFIAIILQAITGLSLIHTLHFTATLVSSVYYSLHYPFPGKEF
jgi:hypothetical protein